MGYFINRECSCGGGSIKEVTEAEFEVEVAEDLDSVVSVEGGNDIITYQVHSCKDCRAEQEQEFAEGD